MKKSIKKISQIIRAFTSPIPKDEEYFKHRIELCSTCEWNSDNVEESRLSKEDKRKIETIFGGDPMCTACGCCIPRKAGLKDAVCGLVELGQKPKWDEILDPDKKFYSLGRKTLFIQNRTPEVGKVSPYRDGFVYDTGSYATNNSKVTIEVIVNNVLAIEPISVTPDCGCTASVVDQVDDKSFKIKLEISTLKFRENQQQLKNTRIVYREENSNRELVFNISVKLLKTAKNG